MRLVGDLPFTLNLNGGGTLVINDSGTTGATASLTATARCPSQRPSSVLLKLYCCLALHSGCVAARHDDGALLLLDGHPHVTQILRVAGAQSVAKI